ncbi:conserved hypothetical protein [Culex quinquefasciatus]|uniref:Uncharacterized protein n=1 Tax=Culex quinquefasciatus TaxID=7176 RepID=B0X9G6_CULQU|nr:conserved hypothetical protein [Culex quinquefasciatus]|eukprot:XP_001866287.1 conserved hypothetical protein [Culex quinquefasciatus]
MSLCKFPVTWNIQSSERIAQTALRKFKQKGKKQARPRSYRDGIPRSVETDRAAERGPAGDGRRPCGGGVGLPTEGQAPRDQDYDTTDDTTDVLFARCLVVPEKLKPDDESEQGLYDARVKAMEVDERPTEHYSDFGGLDKQIQKLIEAVVLPMTHKDISKILNNWCRCSSDTLPSSSGTRLHKPRKSRRRLLPARVYAADASSCCICMFGLIWSPGVQ